MEDWVFVDSCIWASLFFAKPNSPEKNAVDNLIDRDQVALIGPILSGRTDLVCCDDQADWVASRMRLAHYAEIRTDDWQAAAAGRRLAAGGHKSPITDLVVAVVAQRLNAAVYTTDPHFDLISGLSVINQIIKHKASIFRSNIICLE